MEWLALLSIVVIALLLTSKSQAGKNKKPEYRIKGPLFSPAERSFLGVLEKAIGDKYQVFGKVRVADVITPQRGLDRSRWKSAFNRIACKHFDYVLCEPEKMTVIAALELDDSSHNRKASIERDKFLNKACESANLQLIRFPAKSNYRLLAVRQQIDLALQERFAENNPMLADLSPIPVLEPEERPPSNRKKRALS